MTTDNGYIIESSYSINRTNPAKGWLLYSCVRNNGKKQKIRIPYCVSNIDSVNE
jgi:hypothetical protein